MRKPSLLLVFVVPIASACDLGAPSGRGSGGRGDHRIIQEGETLYSIANEEYGDPLAWPLLQEANPWLEPESLQPGDIIRIPPKGSGENLFNVDPKRMSLEEGGESLAGKGGKEERTMGELSGIFQNLVPNISGRTFFGQPVDQLGLMTVGGVFFHALVQGFLLWIVGTITFVKDVTLKKSLKAAFQTEVITLFSVVILGGVAVLMVHIGTTAPGGQGGGPDLLTTLETYLKHPVSLVIGGFGVFGLYLLLCMRFVPQVFGIQRAQSMLLVFMAVLMPHLMGLYTVGQRFGFIKM